MFFSKAFLLVTVVYASVVATSVVASAQVVGQGIGQSAWHGGGQGRRSVRGVAMPCRLKPAIYTTSPGNHDYGVKLISQSPYVDKLPKSLDFGENYFAALVKKGLCIPPRQPLRCAIVPAGFFRRGIEVIHPAGGQVDPPIVNDVGQTAPETALSNYFRAGICN